LVQAKKIDGSKLRVVAETQPIPNYPIAMQSKLAPPLKAQIRAAFVELKDPAILKTFRAQGFVATSDGAYDVLRSTAKVLNLDLARLQ
jgi:phosphonate transport system substrate-binding protein